MVSVERHVVNEGEVKREEKKEKEEKRKKTTSILLAHAFGAQDIIRQHMKGTYTAS